MRQLKINQGITERNLLTDRYFKEISKEELLTPSQEEELARRIKAGDEAAREQLIKSNLRFVVSVAKQYQNQGLPLADLINEGNIGLIKAAEKFDETRGLRFISYAVWWIRQSILQALADKSDMVRIPANQRILIQKLKRETSRFEQENLRLPTLSELASIMELPEEKVLSLQKMSFHHTSMDAPAYDDENYSLLDTYANEDSPLADELLINDSLRKEIRRALKQLNAREREVLTLNFGINGEEMSLDEIGMRMGISRERARQIKEAALKKLKSNGSNILRVFL